jgi:hypothetical protein
MNVKRIEKWLRDLYSDRVFFFDRIKIWLKTDRRIFGQEQLEEIQDAFGGIGKIVVTDKPMSKYNTKYKQLLDIRQPNQKVLALVISAIRQAKCGYLINYIELAVDWIASGDSNEKLGQFMLGHYARKFKKRYYLGQYKKMRGKGKVVEVKLGQPIDRHAPIYFEPFGAKPEQTVMYWDRKSKVVPGASCVHFECRLKGAKICRKHGLFSLNQLASYDMPAFFREHIGARLFRFPTKEETGKAINAAKNGSIKTRQGWTKCCDRFCKKHIVDYGDIPLQLLLKAYPKLMGAIKPSKRSKQSKPVKQRNRINLKFQQAAARGLFY